ncbi:restriction endonuclease subunit S [Acinetobacter faecalis]|uniref:restriction endonuclease subunit S n=1 Tax=Acinetobacter faecalis TaxID=2665161 RepID=UPI002A90D7E4|nr:restriction endonuclease subunit S [Acinetobacter faecalis]MDY6457156.1 restriction endonuclease subunit S [Acinetobacter faecalis]
MAKYQKYAEYKDSGVEWLGKIPSDWKVVKLSYKLKLLSGDGITAFDIEDTGTYPVFGGNGLRGFTEQYNCDGEYALIGRQGALCGNINVARGKFFATEHAVVVYPYETFNLTFLSEFLRFMDLGQYSVSAAQPGIAVDRINTLPIVIPTLGEQNAIGAFLDHETAKIDSLIAKQEKLIELLKEKRQAVISHAVTKGLNPDVAMKDSGVEWLGQVPEHWEISPIKFILENKDYKRIPLSAEERGNFSGDYRYYGASGVIDYIDDYIFDEPNVLVGEDGANLVNRNTPLAFPAYGKYWVNNHAHILHPQDGLADYWAELIEIIDISPLVSGSAQPKLTAEALKNLKISFPSDMEERKAIDAFIKQQKAKFDLLISKATDQIKLLKERRTALISSAVTGKIDVHNWQHPNEAKTEFSA